MKIETIRKWSASDIRTLCIRNDYYTYGTNEDYESLFDFIRNNEPSLENVYHVAMDIVRHSNLDSYGQTETENIESVMFGVGNVVNTFFRINE